MAQIPDGDVTGLLRAWSGGRREALDDLVPLVYAELRRLSHHYLRRRPPEASLETNVLINEAFVRLIDRRKADWQNRAHFFGIAAGTMRDILVDRARRAGARKRGGGDRDVTFDETAFAVNGRDSDRLLALDDALTDLSKLDPELGRLVELRFFGGLTIDETAECLGSSPATVKRGWKTARLWLRRELGRGGSGP
jgi:RNA polymerase sigma factor (TIGR02999 family)